VLGNGGAYDPYYLESAYNAPSWSAGAGKTVAIVDAYDDPSAESDLASYRSFFGLPACTRSNGCFKTVNQNGITGNHPSGNTGWAQEISLDLDMVSAWSGAGSGCSAFVPKPSWQADPGCGTRTVADVSAVADPGTGVWVIYQNNWYIFGGTSVASPIIASMYALAGNDGTIQKPSSSAQYTYGHTANLNDITSGSNGTCSPSYLCTSGPGPGYDGPTGNGTPNGTGAF
jgi:subtilase family serine protease